MEPYVGQQVIWKITKEIGYVISINEFKNSILIHWEDAAKSKVWYSKEDFLSGKSILVNISALPFFFLCRVINNV